MVERKLWGEEVGEWRKKREQQGQGKGLVSVSDVQVTVHRDKFL